MTDPYILLQEEPARPFGRAVRFRSPATFATVLFLHEGRLLWGEDREEIAAPALAFWPGGARPEVMLAAASTARVLGLGDEIQLDAIGARSESVHLRMLVEHPFIAQLSVAPEVPVVETLFDWFAHELATPERRSRMKMSAYLRVLLIAALRVHSPDVGAAPTEATKVLREFRHLVELHYRHHWQIRRYAEEIGVAYDRLHRICKRETGQTPVELVHRRITAEAQARLEKSGLPLKRIAADLGFPDASRFSHFFKRRTGVAPGSYRSAVSRAEAREREEQRPDFADWP